MLSRDRNGCEISTFDGQQGSIKFLYDTAFGRLVLKILIRPFVSKTVGFILNRRISCIFIKSFVKNNGIDMSDYEDKKYRSYNDFFTRKIKDGARNFSDNPEDLPAPCDSKLSVYKIGEDSHFSIKGGDYTVESLIKNKELAKKYCGGYLMLFRLSVDDYHRYSYIDSGTKTKNTFIKGVLHTVNPHAAGRRTVYKENCREYSVLKSDNFGDVLTVEVGAMMVGKIVNLHEEAAVKRGQEKGYFEFGGSTVILCFEKDTVTPDSDLIKNTEDGFETIVKSGEKIGKSAKFAYYG